MYSFSSLNKYFKVLSVSFLFLLGFFTSGYVYADPQAGSIGEVAQNITQSFVGLAELITGGAYIAGLGFAMTAILKFKQHKDNPTQIPIGTPIALLFVAAGLIFLPSIFSMANQTIFMGTGQTGGVSGTVFVTNSGSAPTQSK